MIYYSSSSWLSFVERKSRIGTFTPTTNTLVTDKAGIGQAGAVAAVTAEGLVKAWRYSAAVPPPMLLRGGFQRKRQHGWWWDVKFHGSLYGEHHQWWSMLQAPKNFFKQSLNRFIGAPLSRWIAKSSSQSMIQSRRWSPIMETCSAPTTIWDFSSMASMVVIFAFSRTSKNGDVHSSGC